MSTFWDKLVFQAIVKEPAVLHAVLALSSAHKSEVLDGSHLGSQDSLPNEQERFMLQHYSTAINHLRPHFSVKDRTSVHVALIACIVFVYLELTRGHFRTAQTHVQNGIKLLCELSLSTEEDGTLSRKLSTDPIDEWIIEALSSLHLQLALLNPANQTTFLGLQSSGPEIPVLFGSCNQARKSLDQLLNKVFVLSEQVRQQENFKSRTHRLDLFHRQQCIRAELSSWLAVYKSSLASMSDLMPLRSKFAYKMLCSYYTIASIMVDTCLSSACETRFDHHSKDFISIVDFAIGLWKLSFTTPIKQKLFGYTAKHTDSTGEMGWIPPLYYVAIKCRVHRVRLQAIRLLNLSPHREGLWVATTVAAVARKVMQIEEGDFYKELCLDDDFSLSDPAEERDLKLPALPEHRRMNEVHIVLPDDPEGKVLLSCKRRAEVDTWEVYESEYDVLSRHWDDKAVAFKKGVC